MFRKIFVLTVVLMLVASHGSPVQSAGAPDFVDFYGFGGSLLAGTNHRIAGLGGLDPVGYPNGWNNDMNFFQYLSLDLGFEMPEPQKVVATTSHGAEHRKRLFRVF